MMLRMTALASALMLAGCGGGGGGNSPMACEGLTDIQSDSARITQATLVTAPTTIGGAAVDAQFCRAEGVATPSADSEIKFEVWLPQTSQAWNGRMKLNGTGGYAGATPYARLSADISDGFVTAGSNMGHDGGHSPEWTLNRPEKVKDWGLRAHYFVATAAKAVSEAYYAQPVNKSYFEGCSNGGRQGMMMAQRYPELFDGIAIGAPSNFYPDVLMSLLWDGKLLTPTKGQAATLSPAKLQLLSDASHAACDADDGLIDGQITSPKSCSFDPVVLQCTGAESDECLTVDEIAIVRQIYQGSRGTDGTIRHVGAMPGSEGQWDPEFADRGGYGDFIGHYIYSQTTPPFDWRTDLDFDAKYEVVKQALTPVSAAPSPDLTAFKERGGKLIQFHGWNDPIVKPEGSIAYFNALAQFEKIRNLSAAEQEQSIDALTAVSATQDGFDMAATLQQYHRLFMAPDVGHCRGGTGPSAIGGGFSEPAKAEHQPETHVMHALMKWVEEDVAPESIVATSYAADGTTITRQRPLCPYPKEAVYKGSGDIDLATSFTCETPSPDKLMASDAELALTKSALHQRATLTPTR